MFGGTAPPSVPRVSLPGTSPAWEAEWVHMRGFPNQQKSRALNFTASLDCLCQLSIIWQECPTSGRSGWSGLDFSPRAGQERGAAELGNLEAGAGRGRGGVGGSRGDLSEPQLSSCRSKAQETTERGWEARLGCWKLEMSPAVCVAGLACLQLNAPPQPWAHVLFTSAC